jgi:PAS domain S-box-containing protein
MWKQIWQGETWRGEICNRAKDGHLYWVDTIISPVLSEGKISHFLSIRIDITARKKAQRPR